MKADYKKLDRTAQLLVVEYKTASGSPPKYSSSWRQAWGANVDSIEINYGAKPSSATIWFPALRWNDDGELDRGDMIRIRTDHRSSGNQTVVFSGFVIAVKKEFFGGSGKTRGHERSAIICHDYRWLLAATCPICGQIARGPDDYDNYGTDSQSPIADEYTILYGRRTIFNENGRPNRDPTDLRVRYRGYSADISIFANRDNAEYWTAKQMLCHILRAYNRSIDLFMLVDPAEMYGLDHDDWDKYLYHIVVDGLNVIEAVELICKHLGWSFRQNDTVDMSRFEFFKIAAADSYRRTDDDTIILHRLHAPAVNEEIKSAVESGKKLLWRGEFQKDITSIINQPWGLGAPDRFEFSAELVPAWLDSDLDPDTEEPYFPESEIQELTTPNDKDFYKYYHTRGESFKRNVGRKWALNESGLYSAGDFDRGMPFDFSTVIPDEYIKSPVPEGGPIKRIFGPFRRQLLPCLTLDKEQLSSMGIRVEFSFDGGETWQVIAASISALTDEAGIYIEEENLAEMVDEANGTIDGGDLDGEQLNFFTSLADDKLEARLFKDSEWNTRVRVTASVQMDHRRIAFSPRQPSSGSPFEQRAIYDFSSKYALAKRTESSYFHDPELELTAYEIDSTEAFAKHLEAIRDANQDMSISGSFVLERLWLGDGSGEPDFMVGDCLEKITGRNYDLSANMAGSKIYPEIIKIIYEPTPQRTTLITRDLRFAEVSL